MKLTEWSIPGSDGEPIIGNTHMPTVEQQGTVVIAHGFKGYKDYGMFPRIATTFCEAGFIAHRFNFSHSGMTNDVATFARPDLFEQDTWNRQVDDCRGVRMAISGGTLAGGGLPMVLFGHSRGGVSVLLTGGRCADESAFVPLAGIITAAAPSSTCSLADEHKRAILEAGYLESPSSRTGQTLRIDAGWLLEQQADLAGHDLLSLVGRIRCPVLAVHGEADPTVPATCANEIAQAASNGRAVIVDGANHVFNTANPLPDGAEASPELTRLLDESISFARQVCSR